MISWRQSVTHWSVRFSQSAYQCEKPRNCTITSSTVFRDFCSSSIPRGRTSVERWHKADVRINEKETRIFRDAAFNQTTSLPNSESLAHWQGSLQARTRITNGSGPPDPCLAPGSMRASPRRRSRRPAHRSRRHSAHIRGNDRRGKTCVMMIASEG